MNTRTRTLAATASLAVGLGLGIDTANAKPKPPDPQPAGCTYGHVQYSDGKRRAQVLYDNKGHSRVITYKCMNGSWVVTDGIDRTPGAAPDETTRRGGATPPRG